MKRQPLYYSIKLYGHGAGFWDRGNGAAGDALTALCKPFGGVDLYTGDDGLIYS